MRPGRHQTVDGGDRGGRRDVGQRPRCGAAGSPGVLVGRARELATIAAAMAAAGTCLPAAVGAGLPSGCAGLAAGDPSGARSPPLGRARNCCARCTPPPTRPRLGPRSSDSIAGATVPGGRAVPTGLHRQAWQAEILAWHRTYGCSNSPAEANLLIKKVKRVGHSFRNSPITGQPLYCGVRSQPHRTARVEAAHHAWWHKGRSGAACTDALTGRPGAKRTCSTLPAGCDAWHRLLPLRVATEVPRSNR
jgi:hypothetical protein